MQEHSRKGARPPKTKGAAKHHWPTRGNVSLRFIFTARNCGVNGGNTWFKTSFGKRTGRNNGKIGSFIKELKCGLN